MFYLENFPERIRYQFGKKKKFKLFTNSSCLRDSKFNTFSWLPNSSISLRTIIWWCCKHHELLQIAIWIIQGHISPCTTSIILLRLILKGVSVHTIDMSLFLNRSEYFEVFPSYSTRTMFTAGKHKQKGTKTTGDQYKMLHLTDHHTLFSSKHFFPKILFLFTQSVFSIQVSCFPARYRNHFVAIVFLCEIISSFVIEKISWSMTSFERFLWVDWKLSLEI